ncbi:MAG: hypothetical protein QXW70_00735 [Candidatus Anstonellales archaeon]
MAILLSGRAGGRSKANQFIKFEAVEELLKIIHLLCTSNPFLLFSFRARALFVFAPNLVSA